MLISVVGKAGDVSEEQRSSPAVSEASLTSQRSMTLEFINIVNEPDLKSTQQEQGGALSKCLDDPSGQHTCKQKNV